MPKKKKPLPKPTAKEANEAALLLVEHRDGKGGLGRRQEDASSAASLLGYRRAALMTQKQRKALASKGGKTYWSAMSPKERPLEQHRRAAVRRANLKKKRLVLTSRQ